jgi:hypothetical protein
LGADRGTRSLAGWPWRRLICDLPGAPRRTTQPGPAAEPAPSRLERYDPER